MQTITTMKAHWITKRTELPNYECHFELGVTISHYDRLDIWVQIYFSDASTTSMPICSKMRRERLEISSFVAVCGPETVNQELFPHFQSNGY